MDLEPLELAAADQREVVVALAASGIGGGAVHDGIIAATAKVHDLTLLTLDRRAESTYEAIGADYRAL